MKVSSSLVGLELVRLLAVEPLDPDNDVFEGVALLVLDLTLECTSVDLGVGPARGQQEEGYQCKPKAVTRFVHIRTS